MTRKDYIELSKVMNRLGKAIEARTPESKAFNEAVGDLASWLAIDNPRFDSIKFIEAIYR